MRKIIPTSLALLMTLTAYTAALADDLPQRVVSLGPIITETIYLLEAEDRLIANTSYCKVPEAARHKTKVGTVIQFNVEKIVSLEPDLVLASPLARRQQLTLLEKMGIRVIQVENPETFDKMCQMMLDIGRLLGAEEKARAIVSRSRREAKLVRDRVTDLPRKKVFIQIGLKPLHTAPENTFIHEYIQFSGGINVAADSVTGNYSREKVLEKNPDVILIATMGSSQAGAQKEKHTWMNYPALTAVKNNQVHVLDPEIICSPTAVSFVQGLREIAGLIHPQIETEPAPEPKAEPETDPETEPEAETGAAPGPDNQPSTSPEPLPLED
ncbi:MAG: helical backbone metal receptor [Desulfosudaceae bacterium]